jgi:hypothetical protein
MKTVNPNAAFDEIFVIFHHYPYFIPQANHHQPDERYSGLRNEVRRHISRGAQKTAF